MTAADRERWNAKYAAQSPPAKLDPPSWLVAQASGLLPGRALDLACGHGHAAVWLAQQGWDVTAIDISPVAVGGARELAKAHHVSVRWLIADLDDAPLEEGAYDLIAVFRFLDRKALPSRIVRALRPGGWLVYETFLATGNGPSTQHTRNPEFLLESGELPRLFFGLQTSVYEEHSSPCGAVGRLVARKL